MISKGLLVVAIPVLGPNLSNESIILQLAKLGILYFTWASEHYSLDNIKSAIMTEGFEIQDTNISDIVYMSDVLITIFKIDNY